MAVKQIIWNTSPNGLFRMIRFYPLTEVLRLFCTGTEPERKERLRLTQLPLYMYEKQNDQEMKPGLPRDAVD